MRAPLRVMGAILLFSPAVYSQTSVQSSRPSFPSAPHRIRYPNGHLLEVSATQTEKALIVQEAWDNGAVVITTVPFANMMLVDSPSIVLGSSPTVWQVAVRTLHTLNEVRRGDLSALPY